MPALDATGAMNKGLKALISRRLPPRVRDRLHVIRDRAMMKWHRNNLIRLGEFFRTDKWGSHWYLQHYQAHFQALRLKGVNVLEIGVGGYSDSGSGGNSLRMWKAYFRNGNIYGLDLYDKSSLEEDRIKIFQGDQSDAEFLRGMIGEIGGVDIVIDDGSHINADVIKTFEILFPLLKNHGIYAIEDTQTSYWPSYGGTSADIGNPTTTMGYFTRLVHSLNHEEILRGDYEPNRFERHIVAMHFYHNLILIYKGENSEGSNELLKYGNDERIRIEGPPGPLTTRPKVSIVVPNYNHAQFLRQRLDSIVGQTFQDFELILLDDCSTDGSQSILREYAGDPRARLEFNEKNSGSTFKQWNKGVRLARGEYVWIAESDDYADPRLLEKLVARLDADTSTVFSYCQSWRVSADGELAGFSDFYLADIDPQKWKGDFSADGREECQKYFIQRNSVPSASSVLFRKDVYDRIGGADERFLFCGDWKTWASMALTGGRIAYLGEPLNYHRFHEANVTRRSQRLGIEAVEYLKIVRWILQRVTPTEAIKRKVCNDLFSLWRPKVFSSDIPLSLRWAILADARAVDPSAIRRLLHSAISDLRLTISRRFRSLPSRF